MRGSGNASGASPIFEKGIALPQERGITLICAGADEEVRRKNLLLSPCLANDGIELLVQTGYANRALAYNRAAEQARHELVCCVREDVYLPPGWDTALLEQVDRVTELDAEWALLGPAGVVRHGNEKHYRGHLRESGEAFGPEGDLPEEVEALDDFYVVYRRGDVQFDEGMPNHHLLATEACLRVRGAGRRCYAVDAACHANPAQDPNKLSLDLLVACGYLYGRYPDRLPILAPRVTIQRSNGVCVLSA